MARTASLPGWATGLSDGVLRSAVKQALNFHCTQRLAGREGACAGTSLGPACSLQPPVCLTFLSQFWPLKRIPCVVQHIRCMKAKRIIGSFAHILTLAEPPW